jgi:methionyl-tRNA formyltransferase
MEPLNIVFAGTPDISSIVLNGLLKSQHNIIAVYTQPDRPSGRGKKLKPSPTKLIAESNNIPVYQPLSFKKEPDAVKYLEALKPDIMVVIAYGLLLPKQVLDIPKYGCINIHVSLLPMYRGAAPIQRAILNGDKQTGITIMQMDEGLDTGDILSVEKIDISNTDTSADLHDKIAHQSTPLLLKTLADIQLGTTIPKKQSGEPSYAHKITKEEGKIDWNNSAQRIHDQIRAFYPWPGAYTQIEDQTVKVIESEILDDRSNSVAGTVIAVNKKGLQVATANNKIINILKLQFPGKKAMSVSDILNGKDLSYLVNTKLK